jgi:hypothetical protein
MFNTYKLLKKNLLKDRFHKAFTFLFFLLVDFLVLSFKGLAVFLVFSAIKINIVKGNNLLVFFWDLFLFSPLLFFLSGIEYFVENFKNLKFFYFFHTTDYSLNQWVRHLDNPGHQSDLEFLTYKQFLKWLDLYESQENIGVVGVIFNEERAIMISDLLGLICERGVKKISNDQLLFLLKKAILIFSKAGKEVDLLKRMVTVFEDKSALDLKLSGKESTTNQSRVLKI